jgi:hypothetical protein
MPEYYKCQIQHQIEVCNPKQAFYFCYDGSKGYLIDVKRDEAYIKKILTQEAEFYKCLMELSPPKQKYDDYNLREDDEWMKYSEEWKRVSQESKNLEVREKRLRDMLIGLSGGSNCSGGGIKLSREVRKGSINYSEIPEISKIDLEPYRKPSVEYWKIVNE